MKLYLDDVRKCLEGWVPVRNGLDAIQLLQEQFVEEMSFDHDLGRNCLSGLDILNHIERNVFEAGFCTPKLHVHSMNPVGRKQMEIVIARIEKRIAEGQNYEEMVEK